MYNNNKLRLFTACLFLIFSLSCSDEVLDKAPRDIISENSLWSDIDLIDKYVAATYNGLNDWHISGLNYPANVTSLADLTSECVYRDNSTSWALGLVSPNDLMAFEDVWANKYSLIRNVNVFFENIDRIEINNQSESDRLNLLKAEMKFLRASYYADLINLWGGIPLFTKSFSLIDLTEENRASYQEIVDFIVKELDESIELLPNRREQWGRIDKGTCMALKSEILLYAASKLHDPSSEPSGPLFDYNKSDKWLEASNAAKALIDMEEYSLVEVTSWQEYQTNIFSGKNSEMIFVKPKSSVYQTFKRTLDFVNRPTGYGGWGANCPTHQHVQSYEMANGKMIHEPGSGYDPSPQTIYENREMRFYANILYEGVFYRGRQLESYIPGGIDGKDGPNSNNYSWSSYNMRKFMNESIEPDNGEFSDRPWIIYRLAEIYLNYAEAQYHLNNEEEARKYINKIRHRVNLPDVNTSGQELLEDIRHERRIELAFEDHMFYDARRWMIASDLFNGRKTGLQWVKLNENGEEDSNGQLNYSEISAGEMKWNDKMWYLPIPLSEIEKTDLHQNPGY